MLLMDHNELRYIALSVIVRVVPNSIQHVGSVLNRDVYITVDGLGIELLHRGLIEMADILQTIFSKFCILNMT